jgi:outer membrane receptor protein involved in Fe transport
MRLARNAVVAKVWMNSIAVLLPLCFLLLCPEGLFGQAETGRITGTVTDATGAVVPGAEVTITAVATNRRNAFVTDQGGRYSSGPLRVGQYRIEAQATGFKRLIRQDVTLEVQETAVVNLQLELGEITESVTVNASVELIQTTEASQGQVIEQRRVVDLPLNGRDYIQLALLSEGALEPPHQFRTGTGDNSSRAGGFSAGSTRTTENNYLLDGFDNNVDDASIDANRGESVKPSVDAVQEFKVQTNAYSAEFGRAAGGVVNLTIKSGTNRLHGSVYEFLRNEKLDARNFFDARVPPFKRHNYGFSLGGPIVRDKAFFFFAYEALDQRESRTVNNTIPTLKARQGDFSELANPIFDPLTYDSATRTRQPFPNKIIPEDRFDPIAAKLIAFYPTPQNARPSQNFLFNPPSNADINRVNTKEDFQVSQNNHLSWIFNYQGDAIPASLSLPPPAFGGDTRVTDTQAYNTGLTWTSVVSPAIVTTTKVGWDYDRFLIDFSPEAKELGDVNAQVGLVTPDPGLEVEYTNIGISGFTGLGGGNFQPFFSNGQTRQLKSDTSWIKGNHSLKFGADIQWLQTNVRNARRRGGALAFNGRYTRNPTGNVGGSAVADFLLGFVDNSAFSTDTRASSRSHNVGGYFQDDWKITQRFTLNLGVRYEYFRFPEDVFNRLANVDIDTDPRNPVIILSSQIDEPSFTDSDLNNFQPRIGLAYQLIPDKVVVRAGYGMYYPLARLSSFGDSDSFLVNPPYNIEVATSSDGITPSSLLKDGIAPDSLALRNARSVSLASQERDPALGYAQQWNLNVQYQLAPDWMLQVGYFANKGSHLSNKINSNYVESLGSGNINQRRIYKSILVPSENPGEEPIRVSPLGAIIRTQYTGNSNFHSLQAKVEHEFSQGFTLLTSWIWSRGIGDLIGDNGPGQAPGSGYQNMANLQAEKSLLDMHLSHRLVLSAIWDLPFGRGRQFGADLHPALDLFFGGWSAGGLLTLTAGRPFNVTVNGDPANHGETNRANVVGDPNDVPGGRTVQQYFNTTAFRANPAFTYGNLGRNVLLGPTHENIDFSLLKRTTLFTASDQPFDLQFRWELFNAFNHANFGFPGGTLGNPTFGQLTSAAPARKMQFGLKVIF